MTETRKGQTGTFKFNPGHRKMTPEDGDVFNLAAEMYVHGQITKAIKDAGGDLANCYYFSREVAGGCPINPWAERQDQETVVAMLRKVGEGLK